MRASAAVTAGCVLLLSIQCTHSFLPPLARLGAGTLTSHGARAPSQRLRPGSSAVTRVRMAGEGGDGDMDARFKEMEQRRRDSLDASLDPEVAKERMIEFQKMKQAEADARPKIGGKAPEGRKQWDESSNSPSFMSSARQEGERQVETERLVEEEKLVKARASIADMEIDPRGFIVPKVGDIVLCPGKWANQDMVGLVEATQFVDARMSWNVDVIELNEVAPRTYGKSFSAWKKPTKTWFDVSEVRPARAAYDEEQDGWVVENVRDMYTNPPKVNETLREAALAEYEGLKGKILKDTAILGAGIAGVLFVLDQGTAVSFGLGSGFSLIYLGLLTKQVDEVGVGSGLGILSPRILAPIGLFAALYAKWVLQSPDNVAGTFPSLPPKEIAAAAIGFLAYKLPLLYESSKEIMDSMEDAGEGLESGVSQGYKQWQGKVKQNVEDARIRESNPETTLNPFTKIRLIVTKKIEDDAKEKLEEMRREREEREKKEKEGGGK